MKLINLAAVFAVAFALFSASPAQQVDPANVHGKGKLNAQGKGLVDIKGSGEFTAHGSGKVVVVATSRENIKTEGMGFVRREGNKFYFEGRGKITVRGKEISLLMEGEIAGLNCEGVGAARLVGKGHYRTKASHGDWGDRGIDVRFGPKKNN